MESQPRIFFSGRYSYRNFRVLLAGVFAMAMGGYGLWHLVQSIPHTKWGLPVLGPAAFVGGIGGSFFLIGLYFTKSWLLSSNNVLVITDDGIRYGRAFRSWNEIRRISGHREGKQVHLFFQVKGRWVSGADRFLVDTNPTVEEYQKLMRSLRVALSGKYPEVNFG